jgi:hypothetical protein
MIHRLPPRAVNDNQPREVWTCRACDSAGFLLECEGEGERTRIKCATCNEDVTDAIMATFPIGLAPCQK